MESFFDRGRDLFMLWPEQVTVDAQCEAGEVVTKPLAHRHHVEVGGDQRRGVGVTKTMRGEVLELTPPWRSEFD